MAWTLLAPGRTWSGTLRPPAPPQVAPVISAVYPDDRNGNRVNDALETMIARTKGVSIAADAGGRLMPVQLIFSEPVTQQQIGDFLALDGEITYLFQAVSYGWNGRIPRGHVAMLPTVMGSTLVQVERIASLTPYMDLASQTGRVRPIWRTGFAGDPNGFRGDSETTIAFVDQGVEGTHPDLAGRCAYWRDFSDDNEPSPIDYDGHGSLCAGVALGTGQSAGPDNGGLSFISVAPWYNSVHLVEPIMLAPGLSNVSSRATFSGNSAALFHVCWKKGTPLEDFDWTGTTGGKMMPSPLYMDSIVLGQKDYLFSTVLFPGYDSAVLKEVAVYTYVNPYPGVGDGFRKLSGVAPGCRWAAAKIESREGVPDANLLTAALDDFIVHRRQAKIKILSISLGLTDDDGLPMESVSLRDQINTLVNNGIVVVAAAGNSAEEKSASERKMADPPRAGMAITVGAVNDENTLTSYSSFGFEDPCETEDYKPDVLAPGGSWLYTGIMSVDSGSSHAGSSINWGGQRLPGWVWYLVCGSLRGRLCCLGH